MRIRFAPLVLLVASGAEGSELPYFRLLPGGTTGLGTPSGVPAPRIAIVPPTSASGPPVAGVPLTASLEAVQGRVARWSLRDAPSWLTVDALAGTVAGTPPPGTTGFSFTAIGTDAYGRSSEAASGTVGVATPAAAVQSITASVREGDYVHGQLVTNLPGAAWAKVSGPDWVLVGQDGFVAGQAPAGSAGPNPFTARASAYGVSADVAAVIRVDP